MILKQQNGFGDNINKQQTMKNLEISIHKEAKELLFERFTSKFE
jgi:hypothetical protein